MKPNREHRFTEPEPEPEPEPGWEAEYEEWLAEREQEEVE